MNNKTFQASTVQQLIQFHFVSFSVSSLSRRSRTQCQNVFTPTDFTGAATSSQFGNESGSKKKKKTHTRTLLRDVN